MAVLIPTVTGRLQHLIEAALRYRISGLTPTTAKTP